jgi:negative regulator of flagellin synthesis FlgM
MGKMNIDKITSLNPIRTDRYGDTTNTGRETRQPVEGVTSPDDKLEVSGLASEVGRLVEKIKELPDMRDEKVTALREQVRSGNYQPTSEQIAAAILDKERP